MRLVSALFLSFGLLLGLNSCIQHEVVPPPVNTIDLNATFVGYVNGTQIELTQNVLNFKGDADKVPYIYASPVLSKMLYRSEMRSNSDARGIRLTFGALDWDASANNEPTLTMFNDFHSSSSGIAIPFKDYATLVNTSIDGVQVEYTDQNGVVWVSREADPGQTATFTTLNQASDNTGDYSIFSCTFSCKVWRINPQTNLDESLLITNAKLNCWFRR